MKFDLDVLSTTTESHTQTSLIWISNLCFSAELTNKVFEKLSSSNLNQGTVIGCSKEYTGSDSKFKKLDIISIKMSWTESSQVHLYQMK